MAGLMKSEAARIAAFLMVGGGGFVVHAGVLMMLTYLGTGSLTAWFPAFFAAVIVTWLLNRALAFKGLGIMSVKREATGYFIVQSLGAGVNFLIYAAVIWAGMFLSAPAWTTHPIIALIAGSIGAAGFNYILLRRFIYSDLALPERL